MPNEDLLDIRQAAQLLKVSEVSLRRWTNSGRLPCLRVGGRRERRFRRSDLLAFLEVQSGRERLLDRRGPHEARAVPLEHERVPMGAHLCGLYESDEARARLAVDFLANGFRAGDRCYVVGASEVRAQIVEALERAVPRGRDRSSHRLFQSAYKHSSQAQLAYLEREFGAAQAAGARRLLAVGNVTDFSPKTGDVDGYERGYDERIARRFPVATLCLYDVRRSAGGKLLHALANHPDSVAGPQRRFLI